MSPLAWLAVPVVVTIAAAVVVPLWLGRGRSGLSDQQRAGIIGSALAPPQPGRANGLHRRSPLRQGRGHRSGAGAPGAGRVSPPGDEGVRRA